MNSKVVWCGLTFALASAVAGQSYADSDVDLQVRNRKMAAYGKQISDQYPAEHSYFVHNKTPVGQGLVDEVYSSLRKSGRDALVYEGFDTGRIDAIAEKDWKQVEKADILFCGCTTAEGKAVKETVSRQGFTGKFVLLTLPQ